MTVGLTFHVLLQLRSPDGINIKNVIVYFFHVRTVYSCCDIGDSVTV